MKLKRLLKQYFIFDCPFVRKWCKIRQIQNCTLQIVLMPKQHSQCLFSIVTVFLFSQYNVLVHCKRQNALVIDICLYGLIYLYKFAAYIFDLVYPW